MCLDDCLDGLAQPYYLLAVRLALDAAEPSGHATTLRALRAQALMLGHVGHTLQLG